MKGEELLKFESVKKWIESLDRSARRRGKKGLTKNAKSMRLGRMWTYTNDGKLNPDNLLEEAREDIDKAGKRLDDYFNQKIKDGVSWNTAVTNVGFLRGFYTHNDLTFPKRWGVPKRKVSKVSKRDGNDGTALYDYDGEKGEVVFKNGTLQHFVQNLNFRDQTIALCLLSTGADATDVLKLNVGFVKDGKGDISKVKRFFWHSNREKDGIEFKVFVSEEATAFLKRYVEQERSGASDNEPLFVQAEREYTRKSPRTGEVESVSAGGRLDAHALSINFREASKKMGYTKKGLANPFRPKRFRHWFRTACSIANVDEGYTMAFMGHANNMSASYLERNKGLFEMEYVKVEPFVTVFGVSKSQVTEMTEAMTELKGEVSVLSKAGEIVSEKITSLEKENAELKHELKVIKDFQKRLDVIITNIDLLEEAFQRIRDEKEAKLLVEADEAERERQSEILDKDKKKK